MAVGYIVVTCGPHVIAGHGRDDVVGLLLAELGRRGREILLQGSRIQAAAASVTPLVHGRTVRKTKCGDQ